MADWLNKKKTLLKKSSSLRIPLLFFTPGLWRGLDHKFDHLKVIIKSMIVSRLNSASFLHVFHNILGETERKGIIARESSLLFLFLTSCSLGILFLSF